MVLRMPRCRDGRSRGRRRRADRRSRAGLRNRCSRAALRGQSRRVGGGGLPTIRPKTSSSIRRVPAEAIGAVQPARRFTDGVQALHIGAVVLGAHPDAAHRVVRGGRDLDRFAGDVEHLQVDQGLIDAGQSLHDRLPGQMRDVEPYAPLGGAAPFLDLRVGGQRHAVTGGQLHPVGVVARHEPLPEGVAQDPALAAGRLARPGCRPRSPARSARKGGTGRVRGRGSGHRPRRPGGRSHRCSRRVATRCAARCGYGRPRRGSRRPRGSGSGCRRQVEAVRAEDHAVADQEPGDVGRIQDRDVELRGAITSVR